MRWFWVSTGGLIAVIAFLLWQGFDTGITLTHAKREAMTRQLEASQLLSTIRAMAIGMTIERLNAICAEMRQQGVPVQQSSDKVEISSAVFIVENGRVVAVRSLER
jgi:hypothetical protein